MQEKFGYKISLEILLSHLKRLMYVYTTNVQEREKNGGFQDKNYTE